MNGGDGIYDCPVLPSGISDEELAQRIPKRGAKSDAKSHELDIVWAHKVEPKAVEWLWQDRIPSGKVVTLAGDGGLGKSTIILDIMATLSNGGEWPCDEGTAPQCSCLYLTAEDGIEDTVVPRLIAAGADLNKVGIIRCVRDKGIKRSFNLQRDLESLERKILEIGDVGFVAIDPVSSYLGDKIDSHRNAEVRAVLEPLGEMADSSNVTALCNNHHAKGGNNRAAMRVIGSVAFTAQSRAVTQVFQDPDNPDRRLFLPSKSNLGPLPRGLAYHLTPKSIGNNMFPPSSRKVEAPYTV